MPAVLNFPSSPNTNDTYSFGGKTWVYNGYAWALQSTSLTTTTVTEGTNLYFTNARSRAAISVAGAGSYDNSTGVITITGGVTSVGGATGAISNASLAAAITSTGVLNTSNVAEGGNLYFTTSRVRSSIDAAFGGPITYSSATGNIALSSSGVTANTYGGASKVPVITVDAYGRITSAANVSVAGVSTFSASGNTFTIGTADGGSFSASIQPDSVTLGRDTTGSYVATMTAGNGITVGTATGEGSTPVITNTGVLSVNGQTGNATGFATTANSLSQFASTTSSELATVISDETGSGSLVFSNSPVLITPNIGTASYAVLTNATGLPVSTGISGLGSGIATFLATPTSTNLASAVTDESGTGNILFSNSPILVTPNLGTPSAVTLTNATGLPVSTGISGLGTGVATFLGQTPTSANLATLITDETGTGALVFGTSPAITTSLTTPSASFDLVNSGATTVNFAGAGTTVNIGAATGNTNILNNMVIAGNLLVQGTTTTVSSTTLDVADKNLTLAKGSVSSAASDGAGITIDGANATFNYVHATTAWTSSQDVNLATGKAYEINGTSVLSNNTLGSGVVNSSLTSVGTIGTGTWQGSSISTTYTDAKVTSVNGQVGAATGFATTANALSQFASTTSLQLATLISDETGTGSVVFSSNPVLTTPNLGTPSAAVLTNATGLPIGSGVSGLGANVATFLATPTSANFAFAITDETGSGNVVLSNSPVLVTPNLGTPSAATLTNATGLPVGTGISGLGANQTTLLAANAQSGVTATTYGSTLNIPVITVDVYGRITSASNVAITSGVSSVGGATGSVSNAQLASSITSSGVLTTANVSELTNLYYTDTRARNSLSAGTGISYNSGTGAISSTITQNNYNDASARSSVSITGTKGSYTSGTGVFSFANVANVTVSTTPPGSPNIGDHWVDDATGKTFLYYDDGTSFQWVEQATGTIVSSLVESVGGSTGVVSNTMIATALTGLDITVGNLLPSGNLIQSLGSPTKQFKDLYLSNSTIFIGSLQLKDTGGALTVTSSGGGAAVSYARSTDKLSTFASTSSSELATAISDETGSGSLVFSTSPTLVTPILGTPQSANLINATSLPISTGISGLGSGVATFLASSPTSSALATLITDETGSGSLVFGTSPAITTSLTTPSSSFDLINTTATTVNFAKAATTLSIGAATGTTTVNNNMTVTGNLTVSGTTTTVSSATLDIADLNITVAKGAADSSSANGAGITVDGAGATITYSHTGTKWVLNKPTSITSNVNSTSSTTGTLIVTGGIGASGNVYSSGDITATNFYALSDLALKQNVVNIENPMSKLMGISGVSFNWRKDKSKAIGIIAQDVEKVLPEAVSTNGQGYKVVSYDSLIPLLIESVKSLKAELDLLKKKNK